MSLIKFITKLFKSETKTKETKIKQLKDLKIIDTVWIREDNIIFEGWVMDITRRCIVVCYRPDLSDYRFRIDKHYNESQVTQDNKVLYCNEPEEPYIHMSKKL